MLQGNARVGFEIATNDPPYLGVRGQGTVELAPLGDDATLQLLLQRYLGGVDSGLGSWLLSRRDHEVLISIAPHRFYSSYKLVICHTLKEDAYLLTNGSQ